MKSEGYPRNNPHPNHPSFPAASHPSYPSFPPTSSYPPTATPSSYGVGGTAAQQLSVAPQGQAPVHQFNGHAERKLVSGQSYNGHPSSQTNGQSSSKGNGQIVSNGQLLSKGSGGPSTQNHGQQTNSAPDGYRSNGHMSSGQISNGSMPNGQMSNGPMSNGQMSYGHSMPLAQSHGQIPPTNKNFPYASDNSKHPAASGSGYQQHASRNMRNFPGHLMAPQHPAHPTPPPYAGPPPPTPANFDNAPALHLEGEDLNALNHSGTGYLQ